jgi:GR25 family glycosyltransferase involved in LPS biosynthesis
MKINKLILYIGFWSEHKIEEDHIYLNALKNQNYIIEKSEIISIELLSKYDIIICGSFIKNVNDIFILTKFVDKIIFNITEPIEFNNILMYKIYSKNIFNLIVGCVRNKENQIKYPHYMDWGITEEKIQEINTYILNFKFEDLFNKKFCCLINRHDFGNTRTKIYEKLKLIDKIDCPSNLFNNYSNDKFEKIGRTNFQKEYLFSICPENFITKINGYVTEKLYMACIAGTIPIYYGDLDEIDKRIFNINRIIVFDPNSEESITNAYLNILKLMSDYNELYRYYIQPIFCDSAIDTINEIKNNLNLRINNLINDNNLLNKYDKINGIDHIVWINLDRSIDRRNNMQELLKYIKIPHTRIQAIDGKTEDFSNFNYIERPLTNYEKAVCLSHIKAYSYLLKKSGNYFLILEDDIKLDNLKFFEFDLKTIINNAPIFDILLIHKTHNKLLNNLYTKWNSNIYSAVAYIVSKKGLHNLLKLAEYKDGCFNIKTPLSIGDYFMYNQLETWVYKYNFLSTQDENSIIHPEHLNIHKESSYFQHTTIINDLILNN